jgi:transcriptional regulator with XRE-family HTH domain
MADPIHDLGPLLAQRRRSLGMSLREAAESSGVPVATLSRIEQGRMPDLGTFTRVVEWIGERPERFFAPTERVENTADTIAEHLRADPTLSDDAANKIASIVRDLYESLASSGPKIAVHLRAAKTFSPPALRLLTDILGDMQSALDVGGDR